MKKLIIMVISFLILLSLPAVASAKYLTYEVVEVTETTLTIKDPYGNIVVLEDKDTANYKVGDEVRYEKKTNRLRKKSPPRTY